MPDSRGGWLVGIGINFCISVFFLISDIRLLCYIITPHIVRRIREGSEDSFFRRNIGRYGIDSRMMTIGKF